MLEIDAAMNNGKIILLVALGALSFQCGNDRSKAHIGHTDSVAAHNAHIHEYEQDVTQHEAGKPTYTVSEVFQNQLNTFFETYLQLKEALVSTSASEAKSLATDALQVLKRIDMNELVGQAHEEWVKYLKKIESSLNDIKGSSEIDKQRIHFVELTDAMYNSIKAYGLNNHRAYYTYCPMAFNNKGAYWLSNTTTIRNPYFGDKMLKCGEVKENL